LRICESSRADGHTGRFTSIGKERYRLSFFDDVDEPPRTEPRTTPRTASRPTPRRRRPSGPGGGRRPPREQQSIQVRRAVALGALLVVILLIALGVHSCQVSATNSALQNYTNKVSSLITQSNQNGAQVFSVLSTAASGTATAAQHNIDDALATAQNVYKQAQNNSVPGQMTTANAKVVFALRMRVDGLTRIASEIQPALANNPSAITAIAAENARFYSSDVVYKDYASPEIYSAMHSAGVRFPGLPAGQFVPNVIWLQPTYVATTFHSTLPGQTPAKIAPGLHGHQLNSVTVAGVTLQTGSTNAIPASPPHTFTLNFANTGTNNETNVVCKVAVNGTSVSGTATVPETVAGKNATCQVKFSSAPPTGTHTVTATIEKVPGEKNLNNNSLSFPVTFQ
jgi:hypothetical protein